jgi:hypothetical protein
MGKRSRSIARAEGTTRGQKRSPGPAARGARRGQSGHLVGESRARSVYPLIEPRTSAQTKLAQRASSIVGGIGREPGQPARSTARQAFLDRVVNYFTEIADNASEAVIARALGEPTALGTAAHALAQSVTEERDLEDADRQIAGAIAAGARYKEELLKRAGGAYTAEQLGQVLGISRQAVNDGRKTNLYFGVPVGQSYAYPKLQLTEGGALTGLRTFLDAFTLPDPWMKLAVLLEPSERLEGRSPLDVLRAGDVESPALVAATYGGQGA